VSSVKNGSIILNHWWDGHMVGQTFVMGYLQEANEN